MGCSGKRGGNSVKPDFSIRATSFGPTGLYSVTVFTCLSLTLKMSHEREWRGSCVSTRRDTHARWLWRLVRRHGVTTPGNTREWIKTSPAISLLTCPTTSAVDAFASTVPHCRTAHDPSAFLTTTKTFPRPLKKTRPAIEIVSNHIFQRIF